MTATCIRCGSSWHPRTETPPACPNCHSYDWDRPVRTIVHRPTQEHHSPPYTPAGGHIAYRGWVWSKMR